MVGVSGYPNDPGEAALCGPQTRLMTRGGGQAANHCWLLLSREGGVTPNMGCICVFVHDFGWVMGGSYRGLDLVGVIAECMSGPVVAARCRMFRARGQSQRLLVIDSSKTGNKNNSHTDPCGQARNVYPTRVLNYAAAMSGFQERERERGREGGREGERDVKNPIYKPIYIPFYA